MIVGLDASELAQRIRSRELSAAAVTDAHIERIEATHSQLNAVVIPLFDEARLQATAADEALRRGDELGALHGVPVTIKEQYRVAGTQTTLGVTSKIGNVSHDEGPLVTKLREAGAIILGKTNITQILTGWESLNPVYGRTNNPWNLDRTPGGSSGGEAAIVAAGGSALGLGGDFGGSIRVPAHFCGVHGFKPTSHRLTNSDLAPGLLGSGQELFIAQPGPIARSAADVALAMRLFVETSQQPTPDLAPPVPWTDPSRVRVEGLRIGMYTDNGDFPVAPSIRRAVEDAAEALRAMGAEVEPVPPPDADEGIRLFLGAASAGGISDYQRLLGGDTPIPQIAGTMRAGKLPAPLRPVVAKLMERKGQRQVARQIRSTGAVSAEKYFRLVEARNRYQAEFIRKLDEGRFAAVICPPLALPAFTHGASEHLFPAVAYAFVYNVLGAPAGVVPITRVREGEDSPREVTDDMADITAVRVETGSVVLPIAVQVVARHWHDHTVLAVMAALEQHFRDTPDYPHLPMMEA